MPYLGGGRAKDAIKAEGVAAGLAAARGLHLHLQCPAQLVPCVTISFQPKGVHMLDVRVTETTPMTLIAHLAPMHLLSRGVQGLPAGP